MAYFLKNPTSSYVTRHSIWRVSYFFGEFTKEVIKYCKKNNWALTV